MRSHPLSAVVAGLSLLTTGCAPSLGGLAASSDGGGGNTTVVNPTVAIADPGAFVASSTVTVSATTTPGGLPLEGSLDDGAFAGVGSAWQLTGLADGAHTVRLRVPGAPQSEQQVAFTVDTAAPSAASAVTVTADAAGTLTVAWTPGADGGSGLDAYEVAFGTTAGAPDRQATADAPATGTTLTAVDNCQTYHVTVTCVDRAGNRSSTTSAVSCRATCGGDGTFAATTLAIAGGTSCLAKGDFDADGIDDLAVAVDDELQILLGNGSSGRGDGTFTAGQSLAAVSTIAEIVAVDVDADAILDLVVLNETQLRVYTGQGSGGRGNGTFAATFALGSFTTPMALLVRDLDGDHIRDAVVGEWGTHALYVCTGNGSGGRGDGTFAFHASVATGNSPGAIAAGDFDADGITDLAVACQGAGDCVVTHRGNGSDGVGDGTFAAKQSWLSGGFVAGDITVLDHDGDGVQDLAASLMLANGIAFLAGVGSDGRGNGNFYLDEFVGTAEGPWGLVLDDFTGDHRTDLVALGVNGDGATLLRAGGAHGRPDGSYTATSIGGGGGRLFRGVSADVDADGAPDLVLADVFDGIVVLRGNGGRGRGDGTFAPRSTTSDGQMFGDGNGVAIEDVDGDGAPDLLVAAYVPPPGLADLVLLYAGTEANGLGTGAFPSGLLHFVGKCPTAFATGDFDLDRIVDTAVVCSDLDLVGGGDRVDVLLGTGSNGVGTGSFANGTTPAVGTTPRAIVAGDFDGDAITDLAVANETDDTVTVLLGNGTGGRGDGTFTAQTPRAVGSGPIALAHGDFDSDGDLDLAVGHHTGGATGLVWLLRNAGDGTFPTASTVALTHPVTGLCAGDFDGDGITDLLATQFRPGGAVAGSGIVLLHGDGSDGVAAGTLTAGSEIAIGGNAWALAAGDVDGDRVLDVVVARADAAAVAVLLGNGSDGHGNGTFGAPTGVAVGATPRAIAVGDLDGDGVLDLVTVGTNDLSVRFGGGSF
ncbi:MAG: VCBS repeat-containing protein [Planctomycetes bacterium]|nr:VCBS repeat-containing protein [Planctomycetota bacterium]